MYILCEKEATGKSGNVLYPLPMTGFTLEDKEFIPFFLSKDLALLYLYVNDIHKEFKIMLFKNHIFFHNSKKIIESNAYSYNFRLCIGYEPQYIRKLLRKTANEILFLFFDKSLQFKEFVNYIDKGAWKYNDYISNILDMNEVSKINLLNDEDIITKVENEIKKLGLESKYLVSRISNEEKNIMLNKYIDLEKKIESTDYGILPLYILLHKNTSAMIETGSLIFYVNKLEAHIMAQFLNLNNYKVVKFDDLKKYNQNMLISQTQNQVCFLGFYRTIDAMPKFVFNPSGFPSVKSYIVDKQIMKDGYKASSWLIDSFVSDELAVYENNLELLVLTNSTPNDKLEKLSKEYKKLISKEKMVLQLEDIKEPNVCSIPILKNGI
jgi:hypothetical protein